MSRRSSPVFYPRRRPQSEGRVFEYAKWNAEAVDAVRRIVEAKHAAGVVPAMATWIDYRLYGVPREKEETNEKQR